MKRVGPFAVPKAMSSTASATLGTWFKIKGVNYSISSACATSNHCIGNAMEIIQLGKQDIIFAGGCEELDWTLSVLFDAMGAMSSKFNATPDKASRAYDVDRDGFFFMIDHVAQHFLGKLDGNLAPSQRGIGNEPDERSFQLANVRLDTAGDIDRDGIG